MVERIIVREGGSKLTRDPVDPGGTTKYGISQRAHKDVDIENLTHQKAVNIYNTYYVKPSKAASFPAELQEVYLDMAVKVVQQATNAKGAKLVIDGKLGPKTLKAVKSKKLEPERLTAYRLLYYSKLITKRPSLEKYFFGWYRRSVEV